MTGTPALAAVPPNHDNANRGAVVVGSGAGGGRMRVDESILAVASARWGTGGRFRRPLYDSYCFARLPATVEYLLTADAAVRPAALPEPVLRRLAPSYHTVILVLID